MAESRNIRVDVGCFSRERIIRGLRGHLRSELQTVNL